MAGLVKFAWLKFSTKSLVAKNKLSAGWVVLRTISNETELPVIV
jgi:hypothetical protein